MQQGQQQQQQMHMNQVCIIRRLVSVRLIGMRKGMSVEKSLCMCPVLLFGPRIMYRCNMFVGTIYRTIAVHFSPGSLIAATSWRRNLLAHKGVSGYQTAEYMRVSLGLGGCILISRSLCPQSGP